MGRLATPTSHLSDDLLLQLVDKVYEAALSPARWGDVLSSLSAAYDAHFALLFGLDARAQRLAFAHIVGIPQEVLEVYDREFASIDERTIRALKRPVGAASTEQTLFAPGEVESTRIYNEFLVEHDVPHVMGAFPLKLETSIVTLSLNRSALHGPFDLKEQRFLSRLMPHLQRAAMLSVKLGELEQLSRLSLLTLNCVSFGVVVLDRDNTVLEFNTAARAIFDSADGITMRRKGLEIASREGREMLRNLISATSAQACGQANDWPTVVTIPKESGGKPYRVSAIPISRPHDGWDGPHQARVLLTIYDTHRPFPSLASRLVETYRLSAAECRVAERLIAGDPPNQVSDQLGISGNTFKTT